MNDPIIEPETIDRATDLYMKHSKVVPQNIMVWSKRARNKLFESNLVPANIKNADVSQLEDIGFEFHDRVSELFIECTLPEGWGKQRCNNMFWSKIVDQKGRRRASVFYRPDQEESTHMSMCTRFNIKKDHELYLKGYIAIKVMDADGSILFVTEPRQIEGEPENRENIEEHLRSIAEEWVSRKYPKYQDWLQYWGADIGVNIMSTNGEKILQNLTENEISIVTVLCQSPRGCIEMFKKRLQVKNVRYHFLCENITVQDVSNFLDEIVGFIVEDNDIRYDTTLSALIVALGECKSDFVDKLIKLVAESDVAGMPISRRIAKIFNNGNHKEG